MGNGKVRTAGMAIAMQGSCISNVDVGSCTLKLSDDGTYNMLIGAADMGTGCDTILAQMAAEVLDCEPDQIVVFGADTDASPYDSGSYASSTTYVTGMATQNAAMELRENMMKIGAELLGCTLDEVEFDGEKVYLVDGDQSVSLADIAVKSQVNNRIPVDVTATYSSPVSPPPYMVGMAEIELDKETGSVKILDYDAVVDCGIPVNPNLARVQTEGGIGQGIGMALYENVTYNANGKITEGDFMQYKIPTRQDVGNIHVEFETSYEPSGPFGVKSIGEIVINTPAPALAHAIYRATGVWHRTVPFTPEKILMGMLDPDWKETDHRVKDYMIQVIYMAAGNSRRFGSNKLLFPWKGKTMYRHGLDLLLELKKEMKEQLSVIVVTQYPEIMEEVQKLQEASGVQVVFCKESHLGASYTIKAGIAAMQKQATYLLFMVADQPELSKESVRRLVKASGVLDTGSDCETEKDQPETLSLCCHGIPGNPRMFHESLIPELLQLTGDQGGRKVLKQHTCRYVEIEDEKELMDIDVPVY